MYRQILDETNQYHASLVAVSKTRTLEEIVNLYNQNQRIFGENKVQEMVDKYNALPKDIEWHMIGHLQKNKVKYIVPFVTLIHSVDSQSLLETIEKEGAKINKKIPILLQFHVAKEETKFGLNLEEAKMILEGMENFHFINICGIMGMASFTENRNQIRKEFVEIKDIFDFLKANYFAENSSFTQISMGMSGDYQIALEEGSTMIRIGSAIFGSRNYQ